MVPQAIAHAHADSLRPDTRADIRRTYNTQHTAVFVWMKVGFRIATAERKANIKTDTDTSTDISEIYP